MAISQKQKLVLSADGASDWIRIPDTGDRVHSVVEVGNAANNWGGATVNLEFTTDAHEDANDPSVDPIPSALKEIDLTPISFTGNDYRVLEGYGGYVRAVVAGFAGQNLILRVT